MSNAAALKSSVFTSKDHSSNISQKLNQFYNDKEFFDVTLITGNDNAKTEAHQIVLSACSDYFFGMFRSTMKQVIPNEVKVENMNGTTLKMILDYMYTASIELCSDTVGSVLRAADCFQMNSLITACYEFMGGHLEPWNCLGILFYAEEHDNTSLYKTCLAFAYKHFEKVCTEEEFYRLSEEQLKKFLSDDGVHAVSQEKLFNSLVVWFKHDEGNRENIICSLLSQFVRFEFLKPKFIIENRKKVSTSFELTELIYTWVEWHLSESPKRQQNKLCLVHRGDENFTVQTFNPNLKQWSYEDWPRPSKEKTEYGFIVIKKKFIIAGGIVNKRVTNRVECLDLETMEWSDLPPLRSGRSEPAMAEIKGALYIIGGWNGSAYTNLFEKYDFSTGKWQQDLSQLPSPFSSSNVAVLNERLYVTCIDHYHMECYDPASDKWSRTSLKNEQLIYYSITAVNGYMYGVGGENELGQTSKTVERYDPSSDTWTIVESLIAGRSAICCASWNKRLLACGGLREDGSIYKELEEYDPKNNEWKMLAPFLDHVTMHGASRLFIIDFK